MHDIRPEGSVAGLARLHASSILFAGSASRPLPDSRRTPIYPLRSDIAFPIGQYTASVLTSVTIFRHYRDTIPTVTQFDFRRFGQLLA